MPPKRLIGKAAKTTEIKKALVHRARIRKNYFKLLEKEGLEEHEKVEQPEKVEKPLTYEDRANKVKQRKEETRQTRLDEVRKQKKMIEDRENMRARHKARMAKKTPKGQPMMGPRIKNMLEKIKMDK